MKVGKIMRPVRAVGPRASLAEAASVMWENDCGFVPVVEPGSLQLCGVLTDRDICMGGLTQGLPLEQIPVDRSMSRRVFTCAPSDEVATIHETMREHHVRRVPVVDDEKHVLGVLSLTDLAVRGTTGSSRRSRAAREVGLTLGQIADKTPTEHVEKSEEAEA